MAGAAPEIRFARAGDLDMLVEIEARSFPDPWTPRMLQSEVESDFAFQLLAFASPAPDPTGEPSPVGYATFRILGTEAELLRLAVVPEARGRGIGRTLVERGLAHLRRGGVEACFLEVRETNLPAIGLYESLGFTVTGRRRRYYTDGIDALICRLRLEAGPPQR